MSEQSPQPASAIPLDLRSWIAAWPAIRHQIEERIEAHHRRDPSLHFELNLAEIELKDVDEVLRRLKALSKVLYDDDLSSAERQGTGN